MNFRDLVMLSIEIKCVEKNLEKDLKAVVINMPLVAILILTSSHYFLSRKCCLLFTTAAYIQANFRLDFSMEVNTMNPDQTAPFGPRLRSSLIWVHIICNIGYLRI